MKYSVSTKPAKLCLGSALLLAMTPSGFASIFYVAKSGTDDSTCGLQKYKACHTIQYTISNRSLSGDVIEIGPGTYAELITIDRNLTLRGSLFGETRIDGMRSGTVVNVLGITASLELLTIRNGFVSTSDPSFVAGGILNEGTLSLLETIVTNNSVTAAEPIFSPAAGGILNEGTLKISYSSIASNEMTDGCIATGGILNYYGSVTIDHSVIAENTGPGIVACELGPGAGPIASGYYDLFGATIVSTTAFWKNGIAIDDDTINGIGSFTLDRSSIIDSDTAGVVNAGLLKIVNSTIFGSDGAGIDNFEGELTGAFDMSNSTISGNLGDGVDVGLPGNSTIRNSILAGNVGDDCNGNLLSAGYNLVQNITDCSLLDLPDGGNDITGLSAKLRPLGDYGGPTPTMDLMPGSPAINAGNPAGCKDSTGSLITTDQRGFPRPHPPSGRCDIGAVEVQFPGKY